MRIQLPAPSNCKHFHVYDPGGTTGHAHFTVKNKTTLVLDELDEFPNWKNIDTHFKRKSGLWIVCESFVPLSVGVNTISLEVIGVMKYLAAKYGIPYHMQKPFERKPMEQIYENDLKGIHDHKLSATCHGLTFAWTRLRMRNPKLVVELLRG